MATQYKWKQIKFDLKFGEKALRQFDEVQRNKFVKKGGNFIYSEKVWVSVGPDKDYGKGKGTSGLKVVFQFGKGNTEFAHVTVHNLTRKGAGGVNYKVGKGKKSKKWTGWAVQDSVLIARAKKWAKNLSFELENA
jgi:hypothetical protein